MSNYEMKEREIPLSGDWDVIVVGGGPAGAAAAAASAREGGRTLLIEATGCLGGMGTAGLLPAWCPFTDQERFIYSGLARQVFENCRAGMDHVPDDAIHGWLPLDPERLKRVYDDLMTGLGVTVLFHTALCDVVTNEQGDEVTTLICSNKAGLTAFVAPVFVDATGDGDLAAWAGAEYEMGTSDGILQGMTNCFLLSNVDSYTFDHFYDGTRTGNWMFKESPVWAMMEDRDFPNTDNMCANLVGPGTAGFNAGHVNYRNPLDPSDLSYAYMQGRRIAAEYRDALARHFPKACGNAYLLATGSLMGVRETRRILGDYKLMIEDYAERRSFDDEICRNAYIIDVHGPDAETDQEAEAAQKARHDYYKNTPGREVHHIKERGWPIYGPGESHGVPYRCLTPCDLRNVLVAGRSLSCDRLVHGSVRVMPVCLSLGEAAGIAAVWAGREGTVDIHKVDTQRLRERMRSLGAWLPEMRDGGATS